MIAAFVNKEAIALSHILWIGGPPDCGKTTVADLLGSTYQLQVYHFDRYEMDHIRRADPERHPALFALGAKLADLDEKAFLEWLWLSCTPAEMAANGKSVWLERLPMVIEDLRAMSADRPIIAEGPGFFRKRSSLYYQIPNEPYGWCRANPSKGIPIIGVSRGSGVPKFWMTMSLPSRTTSNVTCCGPSSTDSL